ncbi:addiction module protein [Candidatus Poribacteria bacterium]|nr:MAG: addiction module protein [Candidatus Poribacteria bacterium]
MRSTHPRKMQFHRTSNGREPFPEWLESIQDRRTRTRIRKRLDQLEGGNFGDCQSVGGGVYELRLHFGAGYRIYFGEIDNTIILLLCGRDKSSQAQDIERAKIYWLEHKEIYQ